ncbi:MAG: ABC transporter ATP-binding protein [Burkholderiaceae bacterium]|nr:ABC transporter ATP-binding protein [Burkholderiaceae bacterium]
MSALLDLRIHAKSFGPKPVLGQIQVVLSAGERVSLVGASGCGKSTLLRIAAGLERDFQGQVLLDGQALVGHTGDIGYVFQEPRLFPWLSVADNVAFGAAPGARHGDRAGQLLAEVGLAGYERALPKQLSGGQAQRAAIARGLFTQPRILLLDEPFSAVDAFTRMKLQDLLLRLASDHGITLLLVTHDIEEAVYLSDRVLVLEAHPGRVRDSIAVPLPGPRQRLDPQLIPARAQVLAALEAVHAL